MKFIKLQLLVIALLVFAAGSAFASTFGVSVDTSSLNGQQGFLYLQYDPANTSVNSTATVYGFTTNGTLGAQDTTDVLNGSAVAGTLPATVVFTSSSASDASQTNDYLHAITFGNTITFDLSLANTSPFVSSGYTGKSGFSLSLFGADSTTPLLTASGTLLTVSLVDDGTVSTQILANQAQVVPTPIPAALWLLGSGLTGLGMIRRKK